MFLQYPVSDSPFLPAETLITDWRCGQLSATSTKEIIPMAERAVPAVVGVAEESSEFS